MPFDFLIASRGSSGNLNPLLTAARQLRRKGHRVRVIADPAMRGEVEQADFDFVTWRRAPTGSAADPTDFSDMEEWAGKALFAPAAAYEADIRGEIGRVPADAVLSIDMILGAVLGAEAAGVPVAMLSPHVSLRPLSGVPPMFSDLAQPNGCRFQEYRRQLHPPSPLRTCRGDPLIDPQVRELTQLSSVSAAI